MSRATIAGLSGLTLGTMRLDDKPRDHRDTVALLDHASRAGVTSLHSSFDYNSFRMLCAALSTLGAGRFEHVVKVPAPDFGDRSGTFGFTARVRAYQRALGRRRLAVVQWMPRREGEAPSGPEYRDLLLQALDESACLIDKGDIGCLAVFPYNEEQLRIAESEDRVDALALYYGAAEAALVPTSKRPILAIRPLLAVLKGGGSVTEACAWLTERRRVATAVVSCSKASQVEELLDKLW